MASSVSTAGIRVCARFRPQNSLEKQQQAVNCVHVEDDATVRVTRAGADTAAFTFDQVFGITSTQVCVCVSFPSLMAATRLLTPLARIVCI